MKKEKIAILLTTYNRYKNFINILDNLKLDNFDIDIFVYDDGSSEKYVLPKSNNYKLYYYKSNINNGKKNYFKVINFLLDSLKKEFLKSKQYKLVIFMQDDLSIDDSFLSNCIDNWNNISKNIKNPAITYHSDILRKYHQCWGSGSPENGDLYDITNWVDCLFMTSIRNLIKINFKLSGIYAPKNHTNLGSGVGKEFTYLFRDNDIKLLRLNKSLAKHIGFESKMNNRMYNIETFNYIKNINKKIIISISSMGSRFNTLKNTIKSLENQYDVLNIYLNNYSDKNINELRNTFNNINLFPSNIIYGDLGDTGKFLFQNKNDYYLTCDDDIIYPEAYTKRIIDGIKKHKCIVGFHGSMISSSESYYSRKRKFHFNKEHKNDTYVNILGTGVMGFDNSDYLFPFDIIKTKNMSDIYIAKYANDNNFNFVCLSRDNNWIVPQDVDESIYSSSINADKTFLDNSKIINTIIKETKWKVL